MKTLTNVRKKTGNHYLMVSMMVAMFMLIVFSTVNYSAFAQESDPDELVKHALLVNPELKSIEFQIQALRHKSESVQKWMDPVFMVEYSNFPWNTWNMGDSPMTGVQFKLQQTFTLSGKNNRREATILAEAKAFGWSLEEKRNQLAGLIRKTYWSLTLVRQLRHVTEQHIVLVKQLIEAIRAKYQVGKVGQHDLMRLDVLQNRLEDDLGDFDRKERELSAALNSAMHRSLDNYIATPGLTDSAPISTNLNEWIAFAKDNRPALKGLKARAKVKRLAADTSEYERWPDITVWAGYRIRSKAGINDGTDQMTLGIALPLPFDYTGTYESQKSMYLSEALALDEQELALQDEINFRLEAALAAWERANQKTIAYSSDLIPKAKKTLESTLSAYQSDRTDFASLYQAELQLLEFERMLLIARSQTWIQKTILETLAGKSTPKQDNQGESYAL